MSDSDSSSSSKQSGFSGSFESNSSLEGATVGCYDCEPEYTEEEVKKLKSSSESESSDCDSSRLENLHWCSCRNCVIGFSMTLQECKCCRESNILGEKLQDLKCITDHPDFENLMLNPSVLELSFIRHRRYQNCFQDFNKMNHR